MLQSPPNEGVEAGEIRVLRNVRHTNNLCFQVKQRRCKSAEGEVISRANALRMPLCFQFILSLPNV